MVRQTPPSDWVAYVVVGLTVAGILLGKYLIGRGDGSINEAEEESTKTQQITSEMENTTKEEVKQ
jgi:hypothetical protein